MNRYVFLTMLLVAIAIQASEQSSEQAQIPCCNRVTFLGDLILNSPTARQQTEILQQRLNDRRRLIQEESAFRENCELLEQDHFFKIEEVIINKKFDCIAAKYDSGLSANQLRRIQEMELVEVYNFLQQENFKFQEILRNSTNLRKEIRIRCVKIHFLHNYQKLGRRYLIDDLVEKIVDHYQKTLDL